MDQSLKRELLSPKLWDNIPERLKLTAPSGWLIRYGELTDWRTWRTTSIEFTLVRKGHPVLNGEVLRYSHDRAQRKEFLNGKRIRLARNSFGLLDEDGERDKNANIWLALPLAQNRFVVVVQCIVESQEQGKLAEQFLRHLEIVRGTR